MTVAKRFRKVFTFQQMTEGINCTGKDRALALCSPNLGEDRKGRLLLNLDLGMAADAASVPFIADLDRMSRDEQVAAGLAEIYDGASVVIAVDGSVARHIRREMEGATSGKSFPLEIVGLRIGQERVDQTTNKAVEGRYLFNLDGVKLFEADFNAAATKAAAENTGATGGAINAPKTIDVATAQAKLVAFRAAKAAQELSTKVPLNTPPQVEHPAVPVVAAKLMAIGVPVADVMAKATAIAGTVTAEEWAVMSMGNTVDELNMLSAGKVTV